jgi:hypothetical protein
MSYVLVFENTGDEIPFDPVNQEVLDYYIEQLNQQNLNKFSSENSHLGQIILSRINSLRTCIQLVNEWLYTLADTKFKVLDIEAYLDQNILNEIHADWVKSQSMVYNIQEKRKQFNFSGVVEQIHDMFPDDIQTPSLGVVLKKLGKAEIYNSLNTPHIHGIEASFNAIRYRVSNTWTIVADNPFLKSILTNDQANLSLSFNHLGRTLYNKFINFDNDLSYNDENSYDELLGFVTLNLQPSQTIPLSKEYVNWCKRNGREPIGDFLNIGNIPNLYENLTKYRKIVFNNLLSNNKFSIHKTQG